MSKKNLSYFFLMTSLILVWCWKEEVNIDTKNETITWSTYSEEYQITWTIFNNISLNGLVISENTKNIISSKAGIVKSLNCEAWKKVKASDFIAEIYPDSADVTIQNTNIQRASINEQISNIQNTINFTKSNFDAQLAQLKNQKENNVQQINSLKKNLENLSKQNDVSIGDIGVQTKTIEDQIKYLEDQIDYLQNTKALNNKNITLIKQNKEKELEKLKNNIAITNKQIYTTLQDAFEKIDAVFGITESNKNKNDSFEIYLSSKNSQLKNDVEAQFRVSKEKLANFNSMSDQQISAYIGEVTSLLKLAAESVNNSVSSPTFSQSQIDGYYSTFISLANTSTSSLLNTKTSLDNMFSSLQTSENTYDNQINSLESQITSLDSQESSIKSNIDSMKKSLENLKSNKTENITITLDTNKNTLQSQVTTLESTNKNIEEQINWLLESKNIQMSSLDNQIVSLKQNSQTLGNNLYWEKLYAWVDGIVKAKKVDINNKISSNTLICEITSNAGEEIKIQIYAPQKMNIWQHFEYIKDDAVLWTGSFETELPYKDSATQNYIYETNLKTDVLKEWDKISVKLTQEKNGWSLRVPIQFVLPKLDGQYVNLKTWTGAILKKVQAWDMNNWFVNILSWVNSWDILVR